MSTAADAGIGISPGQVMQHLALRRQLHRHGTSLLREPAGLSWSITFVKPLSSRGVDTSPASPKRSSNETAIGWSRRRDLTGPSVAHAGARIGAEQARLL